MPTGRAVAVWGQYLRDTLVAVSRTDNVVTFASLSSAGGELNLFLTNKDLAPTEVALRVQSRKSYRSARVFRFCGHGPDDMHPAWEEAPAVAVRRNTIGPLDLPGVSLTVMSLT